MHVKTYLKVYNAKIYKKNVKNKKFPNYFPE